MILNLLFLPLLLLGILFGYVESSALETAKYDTAPNFKKITLNATNSNTVIWYGDISVNDAYTVCAESGILQIYISFVWDDSDFYLRQFQLFDNDGLQNPVNGNSSSGCYTVYLPKNDWPVENQFQMFFKVLDVKNCPNTATVFQLFDNGGNFGTLSSTSSGPCEYFVYASPECATDASLWQSFGMYTEILSIMVPASAEIEIQFSPIKQNVIDDAANVVQKGIMTSDSYCGVLYSYGLTQLYQNNIPSQSITLVLKKFDERVPIVINTDDKSFELHNTTTIQTDFFSLTYEETSPKSNGFLIEYTIQKCRDTESGCEQYLDKCANSLYKPFMCRHCKLTCNLCRDPKC